MDIQELLYFDQKRLDTYFVQVSSPVTYDKVPVWETGLSITGPTAKGTQARQARPPTTFEKIATVKQHLEKQELVMNGRPSDRLGSLRPL